MITLQQTFHHESISDEKLNKSLNDIVSGNILLSMASIKDGNASWINTAYFGYSLKLALYFLSPPSAQHSQNIVTNGAVAVSIFDSRQLPTNQKRGLQLFGVCRRAVGLEVAEGLDVYAERFPSMSTVIKSPEDFDKGILESKLYTILPHEIKIFDEEIFGNEKWITVSLEGWEEHPLD